MLETAMIQSLQEDLGLSSEKKIYEATRKAVSKMLKSEGLENAVWSAAIHFNTDNIHVHIATVEPEPMRKKKEYIQYRTVEKDGKRIKEPILDRKGQSIKTEEYVGRFKQKSIEICVLLLVFSFRAGVFMI